MSLFRGNIDRMKAYVPGEQPAGGRKVIKLNTNENPYPPSPAAMQVLHDFNGERLRLYPPPMADAFRQAAARLAGVPAEWIVPGNGSDDLIVMICRAVAQGGRGVAYAVPTFGFYFTQAQIQDAPVTEVPYDDDFRLPVEALLAASAAVTFVANPNSPSGTAAGMDELTRLADGVSGLLVIDEAYVDFADGDALELVRSRPNVMAIRTLSKGYSLAGLRLGYAVANPDIVAGLLKTKDVFNVGAVTAAVGAAALDDVEYRLECCRKVKASRQRLGVALTELGWRVWPSQGNFLLVQTVGCDAGWMCRQLAAADVLVRYYSDPRLADKLRITVGTDEQNAAMVGEIRKALGRV